MGQIIVLIGAPGAGKGTQARLLEERRGIPHISTGDMFRAMKTSNTPLAREVQDIMASGKLIPDDVTFRIVKERITQDDCANGFILDGYPRTAVQAEQQLEGLSEELGLAVMAIEVDVPRQELMRRLTGRRNCPECGEIYNIYSKPPKTDGVCDDHPQAQLVHRADDNEESVNTRLETYEVNTQPLLAYYAESQRLVTVDGTGAMEEIFNEIDSLIQAS